MTLRRVSTALVGASAVLVCYSVAFGAERTAEQWLEQMNRAFIDTEYDGIFSYYSGNDLSTLRVVHSMRDGVQRERLIHLNGAPREIVRSGNQVEFVLQPGDEILELENSIPSGPFAQAFTKAVTGTDYYAMSLHGHDRVANRDSIRLDVMPRDHDRYGFRLWLDNATGLLLRSELLDGNGQKLEIFQFATLKIGGISDADLVPDDSDGALVSHLELDAARPATLGPVEWRAGWVPDGFTMAS
jgi:sigma-E factor negative regulatory protein RseB